MATIGSFNEIWNVIDMAILLIVVAVIVLVTSGHTGQDQLLTAFLGLHAFLLYVKTLDLMRPLRSTGALVRMLLQITDDMKYFLGILATITVGASFLFVGLAGIRSSVGDGYSRTLLHVYEAFVLGTLETSMFDDLGSYGATIAGLFSFICECRRAQRAFHFSLM